MGAWTANSSLRSRKWFLWCNDWFPWNDSSKWHVALPYSQPGSKEPWSVPVGQQLQESFHRRPTWKCGPSRLRSHRTIKLVSRNPTRALEPHNARLSRLATPQQSNNEIVSWFDGCISYGNPDNLYRSDPPIARDTEICECLGPDIYTRGTSEPREWIWEKGSQNQRQVAFRALSFQ